MIENEPVVVNAVASAGRRERNKHERRRRILDAARGVFAQRGFAAATTREIAERADVGVGTLFAYAPDKEALLALVVSDALRALTSETFARVPVDAAFLEQLVALFGPRYAFWAADPVLAQHAVKALFAAQYRTCDSDGIAEAAPQALLRPQLVALVEAAQSARQLRPEDSALVADAILDVYLSEHRDWIAGARVDVDAGVARLRTVLAFVLRSVLP